jgi:peptide deformylase
MLELNYEPSELLHSPVEKYQFDQDIEKIERDMIDTMKWYGGIGLAANQVGINARLFVMGSDNITGFCKPQIFINPHILKVSEERSLDKEGCLSFPNLWLRVKRPLWVEAAFQNTKGDWIEIRTEGYMAKCFQHEFDHLAGICFTDRVSKLNLDMAMKKMRKGTR